MSRLVQVYFLPEMFAPEELSGSIAVVIDLLRATTTMIHALAAGAKMVIPCAEVGEAMRLAAGSAPGTVLLGGERGGVKIAGFDLDNTPTHYTPDCVTGKSLLFTTTNGTRALVRGRGARRTVIAGFCNLHAVINWLAAEPAQGPVNLVCAGTDGQITAEDCVCAGAIAAGLLRAQPGGVVLSDAALLAVALFEQHGRSPEKLLALLRQSRGGTNLVQLGLDADIEQSARWDLFDIVPELTRDPWQIVPQSVPREGSPRWLSGAGMGAAT